jgi:hypothetical protein
VPDKNSFILYTDTLSVLDELSDAQAGKLFKAIRAYHLRDAERCYQDGDTGYNDLMDDFIIRVSFAPFKAQFERDSKKYNEYIEGQRISGSKGGAPKGNTNAKKNNRNKGSVEKTTETTLSDSVSDSVSVSEKEIERVVSAKPPPLPKISLEDRQKELYHSLEPFVTQYGKEMIRAFYNYWAEPNKSKSKIRKENEKFWDLKRRLITWHKNEKV